MEDTRRENVVEISMLSDREKELKATLRSTQGELLAEKERCDRYLGQVSMKRDDRTKN